MSGAFKGISLVLLMCLNELLEASKVSTVFGGLNYFSTFTPFQNATYPLIWLAAGLGSG
jgi:hypothetical protein